MPVADTDPMIRVRLPPALKAKWDALLDGHKITQQAAVVAMVQWAVALEPLARTMVLGQIPETDHRDVAELVLKRMAEKGKGRKA